MALPLNPVAVLTVTYEYLFYLMLSEQSPMPARQKARGLLTGSYTPGTATPG
jgi:hypothetical protein